VTLEEQFLKDSQPCFQLSYFRWLVETSHNRIGHGMVMKQAEPYDKVWLTIVDGHVHGPAYRSWEMANDRAKALAQEENIDPKRVVLLAVPLEEE
jgi:hypothetical protein